jgi:hypothetical protein
LSLSLKAEQDVCPDNHEKETVNVQEDNDAIPEASASTAFSSTQNSQMGEGTYD